MVINQGDVFWIDLGEPSGSAPRYRHPHVVIQNNIFNHSRINTVVVCALTSNLRRAEAPGNVLLEPGEANLTKPSVVNVSQIFTVDKSDLVDKTGTLPDRRIQEILAGVNLLLTPGCVPEATEMNEQFGLAPLSVVLLFTRAALDQDGKPLSFLQAMWMSLMGAMDAGAIGVDTGGVLFMTLMLVVTLDGIFILSTLIGILNNGIEQTLDRKNNNL